MAKFEELSEEEQIKVIESAMSDYRTFKESIGVLRENEEDYHENGCGFEFIRGYRAAILQLEFMKDFKIVFIKLLSERIGKGILSEAVEVATAKAIDEVSRCQ